MTAAALLWPVLAAVMLLDWNTITAPHGPWREVRYKGRTAYAVERDSTQAWLHAEARGTHSALFHRVPPELRITELRWRWRALRHPAAADPSVRNLDDRAAGIFVVVHQSLLPWRTRGLLYQWAPAGESGRWTRSPYAPDVRVLTLENAAADGVWRAERRDLEADLRAAFGELPARIEAIGVLCDADNTGSVSAADFGDLVCTTRDRPRTRR